MRREKAITNKHMEAVRSKPTEEEKEEVGEDTDNTLSTIRSSKPDMFGSDRLNALRKRSATLGLLVFARLWDPWRQEDYLFGQGQVGKTIARHSSSTRALGCRQK